MIRCSRVTEEMLKDVISAVQNDDKGQLAVISDKSVQVHDMYEKISGYLAELFSAGVLTEAQASRTVRLMYVLGASGLDWRRSVRNSPGTSGTRKRKNISIQKKRWQRWKRVWASSKTCSTM